LDEAAPEVTAVAEPSAGEPPPDSGASPAGDASATVVPIPVPAHLDQPKSNASVDTPAVQGTSQEQLSSDEPAPSSAEAPDQPRRGLLGRLLRPFRRGQRQSPEPELRDGSELREPGAAPAPGVVLKLLDFTLRIVNGPFAFLSSGARRIVGLAALTTLAIAAITAALAPLAPRNDATAFVRQKIFELDHPPPAPEPAKPASHGEEAPAHGEKPAAEAGHGGGH
jgi:hypothetical protein